MRGLVLDRITVISLSIDGRLTSIQQTKKFMESMPPKWPAGQAVPHKNRIRVLARQLRLVLK
jgi:hypothetical protein